MTKSNRHKKLRKQEKAKTQLTGVKKLSKAKNVVEPTLRVKKILIREQLKSSEEGRSRGTDGHEDSNNEAESGVNRWKQSIQELLVSTNHHNVNMRKDAIVGLQEIATSSSTQVIRHLDKLLGRIAALTSDLENVIRKENMKLATLVISMISDELLTPFWSMLIAHLKCTMTHLDTSVRYNALSFIELLVDHHPVLVQESSSVLLPCLLGLISTTDNSNSKDALAKQRSMTKLKTEITGKHDDLAVRIKVLRLLSKCLSMSSSSRSRKATNIALESPQYSDHSPYLSLKYSFGYYSGLNSISAGHKTSGSYTDRFYSTVTMDPFTKTFSNLSKNSESISSNPWYSFANSCITVLVETWVELGPSSGKGEDQLKNVTGRPRKSAQLKIGNDKDASSNAGRRNGLHILNESHVESMLSIGVLLDQLLQDDGPCVDFMGECYEELSESVSTVRYVQNPKVEFEELASSFVFPRVKGIKRTHGHNLTKYFFSLMPYESLKDAKRKDVMIINLKLFLIAGKLKMFDKFLRRKLQVFIEAVMTESYQLDENHCYLFLDVIKFIDMQNARELASNFLRTVTGMGYHQVVARFLISLIHPTRNSTELRKDKNTQGLMLAIQWDAIANELIDKWPFASKLQKDEQSTCLFELLTFIALRRLTNMHSILHSNLPKLRELVNTSSDPGAFASLRRVFIYSDAESMFTNEFTNQNQGI